MRGAGGRDREGPSPGRHLPAAGLHPLEDDGQDRRNLAEMRRASDSASRPRPRRTGRASWSRKDRVVDGLTKGINDLFKARKITRLEGIGRLLSPTQHLRRRAPTVLQPRWASPCAPKTSSWRPARPPCWAAKCPAATRPRDPQRRDPRRRPDRCRTTHPAAHPGGHRWRHRRHGVRLHLRRLWHQSHRRDHLAAHPAQRGRRDRPALLAVLKAAGVEVLVKTSVHEFRDRGNRRGRGARPRAAPNRAC